MALIPRWTALTGDRSTFGFVCFDAEAYGAWPQTPEVVVASAITQERESRIVPDAGRLEERATHARELMAPEVLPVEQPVQRVLAEAEVRDPDHHHSARLHQVEVSVEDARRLSEMLDESEGRHDVIPARGSPGEEVRALDGSEVGAVSA